MCRGSCYICPYLVFIVATHLHINYHYHYLFSPAPPSFSSSHSLSLSRINTGYSTIASRTKVNSISTLKGSAIGRLTTAEIEAIEVIIKRANALDTVNEMRVK